MLSSVVPAVMALLLTVFLIFLGRSKAVRWGLVDHPGGRKQHDDATPVIGGAAMFGAFVCVGGIWGEGYGWSWWMASGLLMVVGVWDDRNDIPVRIRFFTQILAALLMSLGAGNVLVTLGTLGADQPVMLGALAIPFTVFAVVGVINAMNMIDGMDGLAGGISLVGFVAMATLALLAGDTVVAGQLLVLAGAVFGFLLFNARTPWRHRAALFMGDAGSMFLGFAIAWYAVKLSQGDHAAMAPATALWLFAIPLMDTITVMVRRMSKGQSPFRGDRKHLHHVLLRAGLTTGKSAAVIVAAATLFACIGILGEVFEISEGVMSLGFLGVFSLHVWATRHAWRLSKILRRARGVAAVGE